MKLYRYIAFESFVDLVQSQSLCFSYPPFAWEDTYEGFLYRAIKTPVGREKILSLIDSKEQARFAEAVLTDDALNHARYLCWSQSKDKLALWSIYPHQNKAVMICTSDKKLQQLKCDGLSVSLMKVNYVNSLTLEDEVEAIRGKSISSPNIFRSKRSDFKHEKEYRAYIGTLKKIDPSTPLIIPIPDIRNFLEGVMVHPSAPTWYVGVVEEYCQINHIKFLGNRNCTSLKFNAPILHRHLISQYISIQFNICHNMFLF